MAMLGNSVITGENDWNQHLMPVPRKLTRRAGTLALTGRLQLAISADCNSRTMLEELCKSLETKGVEICQTPSGPAVEQAHTLILCKETGCFQEEISFSEGREAYTLQISEQGLMIRGADAAGLYYGIRTLLQLLEQASEALPCLEIQDAPDLAWRGYGCFFGGHYYVQNHDNVERYRGIVDRMSMAKMNVLAFESEEFADDDELAAFGQYCREHFVEPVPVHPYLCINHPDVVKLCKASDESFQELMKPVDRAVRLLKPRYFSIAGDELVAGYDVARRKSIYSPEEQAEHSGHEWFAMAVNRLHDYLASKGLQMCMWADGLLDPMQFRGSDMETKDFTGGAPDYHARAIDLLPRDIVMWDWQYSCTRAYLTMDYLLEKGFQVVGGSIMTGTSERLYPEYAAEKKAGQDFLGMMSMTWSGQDINEHRKPLDIENCGDACWSVGQYRNPLPLAEAVRSYLKEPNPLHRVPTGRQVIKLEGMGIRFALNSSGRLYCYANAEGFGGWHPTMHLVTDMLFEVSAEPGATIQQAVLKLDRDGKANCLVSVAETARVPQEQFVTVSNIDRESDDAVVSFTEAISGMEHFCFWLRITDNDDYHYIRSMELILDVVRQA